MGTSGLTWAPCLEPAPFKPYIKAQRSGLCRQLPNSYVCHLGGQSSAEIIRRPILIKSLTGAGTLCLWLSSRTYWEPAVAQPPGPDLRGGAGVGERLQAWQGDRLFERQDIWGERTAVNRKQLRRGPRCSLSLIWGSERVLARWRERKQ